MTDEIESMSTRPVLSKSSQIQRDRNEVDSQSIEKPSIIRQYGSNLLQTSEKPPGKETQCTTQVFDIKRDSLFKILCSGWNFT